MFKTSGSKVPFSNKHGISLRVIFENFFCLSFSHSRYERENKKLLSDNLRLDTENDNLARQLVNSKIEMRKEIDDIEDEKDAYEKDLTTAKIQLKEALDERKRLSVEADQLKSLLKREVDKLDKELITRNNVIAEYKTIMSQLSDKLEKAQKGEQSTRLPPSNDDGSGAMDSLDKANDRIRELELELAQTKLALVETECKNQDLTHQFNATIQDLQVREQQQQQQQHSAKSGTWFSKTLSSIKETTASAASSGGHMVRSSTSAAVSGGRDSLKKSSSVDVLKQAAAE